MAERLVSYMYLAANPEVFLYLKTRPLLTLMLITSNLDFVLQSIADGLCFTWSETPRTDQCSTFAVCYLP